MTPCSTPVPLSSTLTLPTPSPTSPRSATRSRLRLPPTAWLSRNPQRDEAADDGGRYGYLLRTADGAEVRVSMPGVPLEQVQAWGDSAPCLRVGSEWWWWPSAVTVAAALMR